MLSLTDTWDLLWQVKLLSVLLLVLISPSKLNHLSFSSTAHRGLQEEVVYYGWQEAHVLQRPSGKTIPTPLRPLFLFWLITSFVHRTLLSLSLSLSLFPRMPMLEVRCSSAVRRTATPSCPACRRPRRATTGTTASPSSRRTGSSCLPVRPRPSNGIG